MKVILISTALNDLKIFIDPFEFDESPKVGDNVGIMDFLSDKDKETFRNYCDNENKSEHPIIETRSWQFENNETVLYLYLNHLDKPVKPFFF